METGDMVTIGYVAEELNVSTQAIRNWGSRGILVPDYISKGGTRHYKLETIEAFKERELKR